MEGYSLKKLLCGFVFGGLVFGVGTALASTITKDIIAFYGELCILNKINICKKWVRIML